MAGLNLGMVFRKAGVSVGVEGYWEGGMVRGLVSALLETTSFAILHVSAPTRHGDSAGLRSRNRGTLRGAEGYPGVSMGEGDRGRD